MNSAVLCIGANMGDRLGSIRKACRMLNELAGSIVKSSDIFETPPWGAGAQRRFMNACAVIDTELTPGALLNILKEIEQSMGRVKRERWMEREIDIDILLYNDCIVMESELAIPHELMHERAFVLFPLSTIAPDLIHPKLGVSVSKMLQSVDCADIVRIAGV